MRRQVEISTNATGKKASEKVVKKAYILIEEIHECALVRQVRLLVELHGYRS